MKTFTRTSLLGAAVAMLFAGAAVAHSHVQKAVFTKTGEAVQSTFSGCVVSNFKGGTAECLADELRVVYFDFGSARLTAASKAKLDLLIADLAYAGIREIKIVGYADRIGGEAANRRLSQRRGDAVAQYLASNGVAADLGFEIRGLGESSSRSACSGKSGNALKKCLWRDRRVEVEVVR